MGGVFGDFFREIGDDEIRTGPFDGQEGFITGPVQIQPVRLSIEEMSPEARDELRAALMKARLPVIEHQEEEDED